MMKAGFEQLLLLLLFFLLPTILRSISKQSQKKQQQPRPTRERAARETEPATVREAAPGGPDREPARRGGVLGELDRALEEMRRAMEEKNQEEEPAPPLRVEPSAEPAPRASARPGPRRPEPARPIAAPGSLEAGPILEQPIALGGSLEGGPSLEDAFVKAQGSAETRPRAAYVRRRTPLTRARDLGRRRGFKAPRGPVAWRRGVILAEILGPPRAQRPWQPAGENDR